MARISRKQKMQKMVDVMMGKLYRYVAGLPPTERRKFVAGLVDLFEKPKRRNDENRMAK